MITLATPPFVSTLELVERLGIVGIVIGTVLLVGWLFFTRKFVLGSTCDLLVANERTMRERAQQEARDARDDVARIADEFNANTKLILDALRRG